MPDPRVPQGRAVRLDADAAFTRLPRPTHDGGRDGPRPGSERVPATVAGVLLLAAPFGAWVRIVDVRGTADPEVVGQVLGRDLALGWLLLVAAASAAGAVVAMGRGSGRARLAVAAGGVAIGAPVVVLLRTQAAIGQAVQDAIASPETAGRTVTLGWGGWAAMVGTAAMVLAVHLALLGRTRRVPPASAPSTTTKGPA